MMSWTQTCDVIIDAFVELLKIKKFDLSASSASSTTQLKTLAPPTRGESGRFMKKNTNILESGSKRQRRVNLPHESHFMWKQHYAPMTGRHDTSEPALTCVGATLVMSDRAAHRSDTFPALGTTTRCCRHKHKIHLTQRHSTLTPPAFLWVQNPVNSPAQVWRVGPERRRTPPWRAPCWQEAGHSGSRRGQRSQTPCGIRDKPGWTWRGRETCRRSPSRSACGGFSTPLLPPPARQTANAKAIH